jgi:putative hemolysin
MVEVVILLLLIVINGLFSMSEIALVSARKGRLESMAAKGDLKAQKALDLSENPEVFLSATQIGITLISILTGLYSGEKFSDDLRPYIEKVDILKPYASGIATTLIVILVTFLSIIFGELMPKRLGMLKAEKIARQVAGPMALFSRFTHPFVWLLMQVSGFLFRLFNIKQTGDNLVTEEEIKAIITEGSEHGAIEEEEKDIIERVFHLGDRNITSLMTHRTDIVWVDVNDTIQTVKIKIKSQPYSSYPVCDGTVDNIKGLVFMKDLFLAKDGDVTMERLMRKAMFVPENNSAYQLLEKFKQSKIHSCFIVNEYGTLEGLITLNDILEAIVGDVPQTGQDEYQITARKDGSYLMDAQLPFYDFLSHFEKTEWMNEGEQEFDTLAGFVLHQLERIPHTGDSFEWKGFGFEIIDMDGQRIDKILLTLSESLREDMEDT